MYIQAVIGLILVLPLASIAFEVVLRDHGVIGIAVIGKWYVFWAVGARLLTAGLRQVFQPRYTAEILLGIKGDAKLIVRELGIANMAIGSAASATIYFSGWVIPLAVIGTIFYGLAAINHLLREGRTTFQNVAMASDFFAAAVLLAFLVSTWEWFR